MKKISWDKLKKLSLVIIPPFFVGYSFVSMIPGCSIESLTFINSVKKQINKHIPKNKFVLDKDSELFQSIGETLLKNTFILDADLSINFYDQYNLNQKSDLEKYAVDWYEKCWEPIIKSKSENIDLNNFSLNVIDFDISVSKKFYSTGLTTTGLQFSFTHMKELFSKLATANFSRFSKVIDQKIYESYLKYSEPSIFNQNIQSSVGNYAVNQKTFFLNYQLSLLKQSISNIFESPFVNKDLKEKDVTFVSPNDLKAPHFPQTLNYLRFSVILFFVSLASVGVCYPIYFIYFHKKGGNY